VAQLPFLPFSVLQSSQSLTESLPPRRENLAEPRKKALQINYIDSYDYKVVVNIKIIPQSSGTERSESATKRQPEEEEEEERRRKPSENLHKHNRPNYVIDYK
jgi:hypothetical protein